MNSLKETLKKNNSEHLLREEKDIDFNISRPSLIKYYFLASLRWITSYWYLTFPVIGIMLLLGGTAGLQYIQGNDKPVWGTRITTLPVVKQMETAAQKMSSSNPNNFSHYNVRISGPEIHIEIGLNSTNVYNYEQAKSYIMSTYNSLVSQMPPSIQNKVRTSYSVMAIVAGKNPEKTKTNLHAVKPKKSQKFSFYHG